jgi:hypothetical protein
MDAGVLKEGGSTLALSIRQPWAELILCGRKSIEVRTWNTAYRGRVWIHAGKKIDESALSRFDLPDSLFLGGYVGSVEILRIESFTYASWSQLREKHLDVGPLRPNTFAWFLGNEERLSEPLQAPGQIGLFSVSSSLTDQLQLRIPP